MFKNFNFSDFLSQVFQMGQVMMETPFFIKENKLWNGLFEHKWIGTLTLIISILFSWYLFDDLKEHFSMVGINTIDPVNIIVSELGALASVIDEEWRHTMFSGGTKYLLLILLEIIIFYFCVKTLSILSKKNNTPAFNNFYRAEKRMIKLMLLNFGTGLLIQLLCNIAFSMVGLKSLVPVFMFCVYTYFIGYAFLDNYNEQFLFNFKQSKAIIRQHFGAAFALGLIVTLLLYIPLIGPLLAPIFGGICGTIYGFRYSLEDTDLKPLLIK